MALSIKYTEFFNDFNCYQVLCYIYKLVNNFKLNMKICESCGMPLENKTISKFDTRYCIYCQNQETGVLKSMDEVREGSIGAAIKLMGKTRKEAENMADEMMPKLPRWKK